MTVTISVGGVDVTHLVPLETLRLEEAVDSRASCTFRIDDFGNNTTVSMRADVTITESGNLFRGMVLTRRYTQHVHYREIEIEASDYSLLMDERIVGAPSGGIYAGPDAQGNYASTDPYGATFSDDATTITQWFNHYTAAGINTTTYVTSYLPAGYLGSHPLYFKATTLRSALQGLAAVAGPNVHFWIDPDLNFHWQAFPIGSDGGLLSGGNLLLLFPDVPELTATSVGIAEAALVDYSTLYGVQDPPGLVMTWDGTNIPEQVYLTGSTDFVYTPTGTLTVTIPVAGGKTETLVTSVPVVQGGGTGWYPFTDAQGQQAGDASKRQAVVPSEASTLTERAADGTSAVRYASREIIRGVAEVISTNLVFHAGQSLRVRFPTSLGVDGSYAIQKVTTQYLSGDAKRMHSLEFGDAPLGRLTQARPPLQIAETNQHAKLPGSAVEVGHSDANPKPGSSQLIPVKVSAPDGVTVSKIFSQTVNFVLFYYRNNVLLTSPPASISPTSTPFVLNGTVYTTISYTADAMDGDVAFVAAYLADA